MSSLLDLHLRSMTLYLPTDLPVVDAEETLSAELMQGNRR